MDLIEEVNKLRNEIQAIEYHILWLKENKKAELDLASAKQEKIRLVDRLDKLMGLK